jgi:hypothetical protein
MQYDGRTHLRDQIPVRRQLPRWILLENIVHSTGQYMGSYAVKVGIGKCLLVLRTATQWRHKQ